MLNTFWKIIRKNIVPISLFCMQFLFCENNLTILKKFFFGVRPPKAAQNGFRDQRPCSLKAVLRPVDGLGIVYRSFPDIRKLDILY